MGYGSAGEYRMEKQVNEDNNAGSKGVSNKSERAVSKSNANYDNSGWDLIDAQKQKDFKLDDLKQDELPKELQGKTREEQEKIIAEKAANRSKYQENINELAKKRSEFIQVEKEKRALESGQEDLGTSIIKSMNVSAEKQGYTTGK